MNRTQIARITRICQDIDTGHNKKSWFILEIWVIRVLFNHQNMYLSWDKRTLENPTESNIEDAYNLGYVFTRVGKNVMNQTRSLRIDLSKFKLSSENKRILHKTESLSLIPRPLPLDAYHWSIAKMAKDFYDTKFGQGTLSANKMRELLTDGTKNNFNRLFIYEFTANGSHPTGYCVALETPNIVHYSYPFYHITNDSLLVTNHSLPNLGMGMMTMAVQWAKKQKKNYIYLGSAQRPTDVYKLQFEGMEWFDGEKWNTSMKDLKQILSHLE